MMSGFLGASTLTTVDDGRRISLATAGGLTPAGPVENPTFFSGFLARPDVAAAGLLCVADVAMARYADAGLMQRLANLDPIVTASGDRLRFESFSACNGVHARFDLLGDGVDSGEIAFGTTNVDINAPLRLALSKVGRTELLHLAVGADEIRASTLAATHVERKVGLPDRWVRGCAEAPAFAREMTLFASLRGPAAVRFLGTLPRVTPPGPNVYLTYVAGALRTTPQALRSSMALNGASRLAGAARITRHTTALHLYAGPHGSSGWVFEVPGGRLTLLVSPGPFRGFSGEGTLLTLLADGGAASNGERLSTHLAWSPRIQPDSIASATSMSGSEVAAGLAWLSASGRVGFDLSDEAYFHRDLPIDTDKVLRRNPRLAAARAIVAADGVRVTPNGWQVHGSRRWYDVERGDPPRCSCQWQADHDGTRGPCKHLLAIAIKDAKLA
jgi:hypothetical protein